MFYKNDFVGDVIYGDITEATNHKQLESLIKKLQNTLTVFAESEKTHPAPAILKETYQKRLEEVVTYYIKVGGNIERK